LLTAAFKPAGRICHTSPSVITRQPTRTSPGPGPSVASHVFGPSTTQVDPNSPDRSETGTSPGSLKIPELYILKTPELYNCHGYYYYYYYYYLTHPKLRPSLYARSNTPRECSLVRLHSATVAVRWCLGVSLGVATFVYRVETAKDTAIVAMECE